MNLAQKLALTSFRGGAGQTSQLFRVFTFAENEVTKLLRELLKCNSLPLEFNFFLTIFSYILMFLSHVSLPSGFLSLSYDPQFPSATLLTLLFFLLLLGALTLLWKFLIR